MPDQVPDVTRAHGTAPDRQNAAADIMLDDLAWWSAALEKARAGGELQPGSFRLRAALAAAK